MSHAHHHGHSFDQGSSAAAVRRVFLITLVLNLAVTIAKATYGYLAGSLALGSDAIHAGLDGASNVLALLSLHWSHLPADDRHPYGRRKLEILAALGVGVLIVIGLFEMSLAAAASLFGGRHPPSIGWGGFGLLGATMIINFFVTRYEEKRGHTLGSPLLCADAQHTRSDLYASVAVGLSFLGVRLGFPWADPLGALFVIVMVGRAAWMVFRDNVPTLIDAAVLDPQRVADVAAEVGINHQVGRVRTRGLRSAVQMDLHVEVDPAMSVHEAHQLGEKIEATLRQAYPQLSDVVIHMRPAAASPASRPVLATTIEQPSDDRRAREADLERQHSKPDHS